jgi:hypothetical protein
LDWGQPNEEFAVSIGRSKACRGARELLPVKFPQISAVNKFNEKQ